eukprot:TRINITY_DN15143_c0_g2_i2.p1 TRINITY_DN15143_c0_g2~~TRINITY_DN15143_c0_g2_i2.p1  ORF type:complete len:233 (+),score=42.36 TRINITY_DN15143_c0_g2_i2:57-755(+)
MQQRRKQRFSGLIVALALVIGTGSLSFTSLSRNVASRPVRSLVARQAQIEVPGGMKNGLKILVDDIPARVMEFASRKQGKGIAITKAKLRNLLTGAIIEKTLNSGQRVDVIDTDWKSGTYSYFDGTDFMLLDTETLEEASIPAAVMGDWADWIPEGAQVDYELYEGQILGVQVKGDIILEVTECTQVKNNGKDVTVVLSNGVTRSAPAYIKVGDKVLLDPLNNFAVKERVKE